MSEHEDVEILLGGERATFDRRERPAPSEERGTLAVRCDDHGHDPCEDPACAPSVYFHERVLRAVTAHAESSPKAEVGGVLLGSIDRSAKGPYVRIEQALPARQASERRSELTFTHETWAGLNEERARTWPELQVIGWYHTHPGLGVFFSDQDRFIHRNFFAQEAFVGLVTDPSDGARALFQWRDSDVRPAPGFYVYGPTSRRKALKALARPPVKTAPASPVRRARRRRAAFVALMLAVAILQHPLRQYQRAAVAGRHAAFARAFLATDDNREAYHEFRRARIVEPANVDHYRGEIKALSAVTRFRDPASKKWFLKHAIAMLEDASKQDRTVVREVVKALNGAAPEVRDDLKEARNDALKTAPAGSWDSIRRAFNRYIKGVSERVSSSVKGSTSPGPSAGASKPSAGSK